MARVDTFDQPRRGLCGRLLTPRPKTLRKSQQRALDVNLVDVRPSVRNRAKRNSAPRAPHIPNNFQLINQQQIFKRICAGPGYRVLTLNTAWRTDNSSGRLG